MRQFLLAGNVAYSNAVLVQSVAAGAVGFFYLLNGVATVTATGSEILGKAMLVLGRTSANGGPVILPIHKRQFSYVKSVYQAATKFVATVVIPAPATKGTYSIIINKNGVKFNERNAYTYDTYVPTDGGLTAAQLAQKLVDKINASTNTNGIIATLAAATITITAVDFGQDYSIIPADKLMGIVPTYTTRGIPAINDSAMIRDLMNKAAADKGINYTYSDDLEILYPTWNVDPLSQPAASDVGYILFTLRFAEPRDVKTRDETAHQIVQVAFPTGTTITSFENVCKTLSGIAIV